MNKRQRRIRGRAIVYTTLSGLFFGCGATAAWVHAYQHRPLLAAGWSILAAIAYTSIETGMETLRLLRE